MTRVQTILVCLLGSLGLCSLAKATIPDSSGNPYQQIAQNNIFRLKPPQVASPEPAPRPPLPRVTLTGITTMLGKRVLLKVQFPANPPEPPREQSYILAEGQRDDPIEVLEINEKAGSVRLILSGTDVELTFEKDGPKQPNAPPIQTPPPRPPPPVPGR